MSNIDANHIEMMRLIGDLKPGKSIIYYQCDIRSSLSHLCAGTLQNEKQHEKFIQWCRTMMIMNNIAFVQRKTENEWHYIACVPFKKIKWG